MREQPDEDPGPIKTEMVVAGGCLLPVVLIVAVLLGLAL